MPNNRPLSKEALAAVPVLRSLIISEKGTSTLKRILNDYCKEEGEPLPFRKFGFPSAVEYLKATDEFVLQTHMGETTIFVKPKADTAHIQKMVAAQKPAKVQTKRNVYHWKNPQLRFSSQTGYMPKPPQPMQRQFGASLQNNPNNPLNRFFPKNSNSYYPKISVGNENVPPKPSEPPKFVPMVSFAKVASAVKVEPRKTKPAVMAENVPPPPAVTVTQQAYVRPMPNYNYTVKRESPPADLPMQSAPRNPCAVQNQNQFPVNPFQNGRFVPQAKNNQFNDNLQCPPGFNYRQSTVPTKPYMPIDYYVPPPAQYQAHNIPYSYNPFRTNYQSAPPQQQFTAPRIPMTFPYQHQTPSPPPPPPSVSSDQIINLLDQQVQMLNEVKEGLINSQHQSRIRLQNKLNQEVEMMEAIVRQYQQSVTDQQFQQQAAVDRLNQQLEMLHASCRAGNLGGR